MVKFPLVFFVVCLVVFWIAGQIGAYERRRHPLKDNQRDDFGIVMGATLTLLGLIIGFSFSMAISRYDLRKNYEEAEANAIGTEYVRADFLPPATASVVKEDLKRYTDLRIARYETRNDGLLKQINSDTARLQDKMWTEVRTQAADHETPVLALTVSGMNDVLNSQGYTQAAWWNRIPVSAWALLVVIAMCANFMVGYGARASNTRTAFFFVLPLLISVSFFLIADIDSPQGGLIRLDPQNLISLSQSISH